MEAKHLLKAIKIYGQQKGDTTNSVVTFDSLFEIIQYADRLAYKEEIRHEQFLESLNECLDPNT